VWDNLPSFQWALDLAFSGQCESQATHCPKKGKQHAYYSLSETIRINRNRTVPRRVLNLGELNTTQTEQWQRSIEVIEAEGQSRQRRLFTDREGRAPVDAADACEVILSSLSVRRPREFGACWLGSRLWQELGLDEFF
jgi:hypothetical protein